MNDQGLANAIFGAMALIVLIGLACSFALSRVLVRRLGWNGTKKNIAMLGFTAIGIGAGVLAVFATFYESSWSPPPKITLVVPPGFAENWVIMLEDPAASQQLEWKGTNMPFSGKSAVINVAANGIVRVKSLGELIGRMDNEVEWSDGARSTAQAGGPAPKTSRATLFSAFNRVGPNDTGNEDVQVDPPFGEEEALGKHILERENAAQ
jgi:hypothetical protein